MLSEEVSALDVQYVGDSKMLRTAEQLRVASIGRGGGKGEEFSFEIRHFFAVSSMYRQVSSTCPKDFITALDMSL